jgi:3-oxoacyl-[acyl-carrier protein] reductase
MDTGLKNRSAIVAASSQGLGKACAGALAAEGADVALCARNEKTLTATADEIRSKYGVKVFSRALDVTDAAAVQKFVAEVVHEFGKVDVCVTNAGGPPAKDFLSTTPDDWRRAFELNLLSTVLLAKEVIPHMQQRRWGRIVTITSISVKQPIPDLILSNSIRTGVAGLVRSLANDFGKDGILVNNVGPGYTRTERLKSLTANRARAAGVSEAEIEAKWAQDTALGRIAEPQDVAAAVVFLASEQASSITGQTILVDSGTYRGL